jgi:hypothetical protein
MSWIVSKWLHNGWAAFRDDIMLIVCGSAISWVIGRLLRDKGGFYGRVTGRLFVKPFTLGECEAYFREVGIVFSRYQMVESYMIFGGIPYCLSLMRRELGFAQNVDRLRFREAGALRDEYDLLYRSLFHLRFIKGSGPVATGYWTAYTDDGGHRAWTGYSFEQVALSHIDQIKRQLQIGGVLT